MIARFESFSIEHVRRERNREADRLANLALDAAAAEASATEPFAHRPNEPEEPKAGQPLRTSATFRNGVLEPHFQLSLLEGEVVDLEIYQKE